MVGESNYQAQLIKICGKPSPDGVNQKEYAHLIFEDGNKFDNKAVRIAISDLTVGYLSRSTAREFRSAIAKSNFRTHTMFQCAAVIRGGWDRGGGDKGMYGVRLDLPDDGN